MSTNKVLQCYSATVRFVVFSNPKSMLIFIYINIYKYKIYFDFLAILISNCSTVAL